MCLSFNNYTAEAVMVRKMPTRAFAFLHHFSLYNKLQVCTTFTIISSIEHYVTKQIMLVNLNVCLYCNSSQSS